MESNSNTSYNNTYIIEKEKDENKNVKGKDLDDIMDFLMDDNNF